MRKLFTLFLCSFSIFFVSAQNQADSAAKKQTVHGVVRNEKDEPVENVLVAVEGGDESALTDSLGFFRIEARPNATLIFNADGYESLLKGVNHQDIVKAVLSKAREEGGNSAEILKQQTLSNSFQDFNRGATSGSLPVMHQSEETKGSRYYFRDWVKGTVINAQGQAVTDNFGYYNYDKISRALLITRDRRSMIQVNYADINSFTLKHADTSYVFTKLAQISTKDFFIQLVKPGNKYGLYKAVETKFEKSDYRSDGLVESGKDYDEYVDHTTYYVTSPDGKQVKTVELKKKSIRGAFADEKDKVNAYFSDHKDQFLNEAFLVGLVNSVNQ